MRTAATVGSRPAAAVNNTSTAVRSGLTSLGSVAAHDGTATLRTAQGGAERR